MKVEKVSVLPKPKKRLNVAAYCRVSTNSAEQELSYVAQVSYYRELISSNPEWVLVDIYADEGITGTQKDNRPAFQRMMRDCYAGKIDIILTKSISRLSRNTVDLLETVRELRRKGIDVHFEKEKINILSENGEFMLTILASLAEEESRSISENIKWAVRKNFEQGKANNFLLYGYHWDGNEYHIIPEQAEVVRRIYDNYLAGISAEKTAKQFADEGIPGPQGDVFHPETIRRILENERYTGDRMLQKQYIENHRTHKRRVNNGELTRFYAEGVAPAIISSETYEAVQKEIQRRRKGGYLAIPGAAKNPFTMLLYCGFCGCTFRKASKKAADGSRKNVSYLCSRKYNRRSMSPASTGGEHLMTQSEFKHQSPTESRLTTVSHLLVESRALKKDGTKCPSHSISETELMRCVNEVLGLSEFNEDIMRDKIGRIMVMPDHTVIFKFLDGQSITKKYVSLMGGNQYAKCKSYRTDDQKK